MMDPLKLIEEFRSRLDRIEHALHTLNLRSGAIMTIADDILTDVQELPSIDDSLDALFSQLAALIADGGGNAGDPAKLEEAFDIVTKFKDRTKAAIVANTPAAPPAPPVA